MKIFQYKDTLMYTVDKKHKLRNTSTKKNSEFYRLHQYHIDKHKDQKKLQGKEERVTKDS